MKTIPAKILKIKFRYHVLAPDFRAFVNSPSEASFWIRGMRGKIIVINEWVFTGFFHKQAVVNMCAETGAVNFVRNS
jgi:hypothetical protein